MTDSFMRFLADLHKTWWVYTGIAIPSAEAGLLVAGSSAPILSLIRTLLGLSILGFLPGYLTVRAFFPRAKEMPKSDVVLMSIFLNLLIAEGTGIGLGVGPFFDPTNVSYALTGFSIPLAFVAGYRSFSSERKAKSGSEIRSNNR